MAWPQQYNGWQQATGLNSQLCRWLSSFSMNLIKESRILLPELSLDLQNYRFVPIVQAAFWSYTVYCISACKPDWNEIKVRRRLKPCCWCLQSISLISPQPDLYSLDGNARHRGAAGGTLHNKINLTNSLYPPCTKLLRSNVFLFSIKLFKLSLSVLSNIIWIVFIICIIILLMCSVGCRKIYPDNWNIFKKQEILVFLYLLVVSS